MPTTTSPGGPPLLDESLTLYRTLGFPRFIALVLLSLGEVALAEGDPARARELLQQSLTGMREVGENLGIPAHSTPSRTSPPPKTKSNEQSDSPAPPNNSAPPAAPTPGPPRTNPNPMAHHSTRNTERNRVPSGLGPGQAATQQQAIAYALDEPARTREPMEKTEGPCSGICLRSRAQSVTAG